MIRFIFYLVIILSFSVAGSLTVYSNNFSNYNTKVDFNITKQKFTLYYRDLPNSVFLDSIYPKFSNEISILSQTFVLKSNIIKSLLKSNLNQEVEFYENRFSREPKSGKLISIEPIIIESNNKFFIINESSRVIYSTFPKVVKPHIKWELLAKSGVKKATLNLSYQLSGVKWESSYIANIGAKKLTLFGWAKIENNTDIDFREVNLSLIAGEVNKIEKSRYNRYKSIKKRVLSMSIAPESKPSLNSLVGLYRYSFKDSVDILKDEIKNLPLFGNKEIHYKRYGVAYNSSFDNYGQEKLSFAQFIEFKNSFNNPLPAGRVKVYKNNNFIGEDFIKNTPKNENIKLKIGTLFDVKGDKKITKFISREHYKYVETTYIVKNRAKEDITLKINENIPRYGDNIELNTTCSNICKRDKNSAFLQTFTINLKADSSYSFKSSFEVNY